MKDWIVTKINDIKYHIVKFLGGYSVFDIYEKELIIEKLEEELKQARKNDVPPDPKTGRFVKK